MRETNPMDVKPDPAVKYLKTIEFLTREADADKAQDLILIGETFFGGTLQRSSTRRNR